VSRAYLLPPERWPTADEAATSLLFTPLELGRGQRLECRAVVPAMVPWRATPEGDMTPALFAWYRRLAEGQPGALVVEATGVRDVPSGPLLRIHEDRFVPGLTRLRTTIEEGSAGRTRAIIQLIDFLRVRRRPDPARYFAEHLHLTDAHRRGVAALTSDAAWLTAGDTDLRRRLASLPEADRERLLTAREREDLLLGARERVTDLDLPHIRALPTILPGAFAAAAQRAERAGFDGVELHAAHAYTLASLLSTHNTRADGFGGPREHRVRLPLAVLRAVRAALAPSMVVGVRLLGDEVIAGGTPIEDAAWFAVQLAAAGADYVSLSVGGKFEDARTPSIGQAVYPYTGPSGRETMPQLRASGPSPFGRHLHIAHAIRAALRAAGHETPVVAAGGLTTFTLIDGALRRRDADLVAVARQSLADPDWLLKLRSGDGSQIRRCELTNYCEGLDQRHRPVTCRLWDREPIAAGEPDLRDGRRRLVAPRRVR
jgi:2,4-dienoyl-CoA reductase-like NADH-dependent reductase (Old Yellow Enzyme family)